MGKISGKWGPDSKVLQQAVKEGEANDLNIRPISSYFAQPPNAAGQHAQDAPAGASADAAAAVVAGEASAQGGQEAASWATGLGGFLMCGGCC